jgi:UDP:flavonoid glycosyltransferase YjiC (YdhE family)
LSALCFVAPPFAGHLNPQVALARGALEAGHAVEVLTGPAKVEVVRNAGVPAATLVALAGDPVTDIADWPRKVGSNPFALVAQMRAALPLMAAVAAELTERWRRAPPDLVVADFTAVPAGLAADALGVPWFTTLRAAFALEGRHGPPSYLGGLRPWPGPLGALRDRMGWWGVRRGKDALAAIFARELRQLGLARRRWSDGAEAIYSRRRILALDMAELEFPRDWPAALRFIGPVSDNPEPPLELDLPPGRPRVLVTLGTHLPWAKTGLVEEVAVLAARRPAVTFVVSMGRSRGAAAGPRQAGPNLFVYDFTPYRRYLPEMDAVIHHGGAGVTGACIEAGRPALVWPRDYDQFDYAARLAHHGLGTRVRGLRDPSVAEALDRLLACPRPALARFQALAARYDPVAAFLREVRDALAGPPP